MTTEIVYIQPGSLAEAREHEQRAAASDNPWIRAQVQCDRWLRSPDFAEGTREQYALIFKAWFTWCEQINVPPFDATRSDFTGYTDALLKVGNPAAIRIKPLSRRSIVRHMAVISDYYDTAIDAELTERNPVPKKRPKVNVESRQPYLEPGQIRDLIDAADAHSDRASALVALLALACVRVTEALTVTIDDLSHEGGARYVRVTRKGGKVQKVLIPQEAWERLVPVIGIRKTGTVITGARGGRFDRKSAWELVRELGAGFGFTIGPHTFRHAYITRARELGIPVEEVQRAAGHLSVVTTRNYDRSHLDPTNHPSVLVARDLAGKRRRSTGGVNASPWTNPGDFQLGPHSIHQPGGR
jgi:integrase/recombinase XerD